MCNEFSLADARGVCKPTLRTAEYATLVKEYMTRESEYRPAALDKAQATGGTPGRPSKRSMKDAQRTLNDNQLRLAVWLSMPERHRKPVTQKEFCEEIGISLMSFHRWRKDPNVVMATRWLTLNAAGDPGRVSAVLDFLHETTLDESISTKIRLTAARDWLKAIGVHEAWSYDNKLLKIQDVDEINLEDLSDEEIWELYNERARMIGLGDGNSQRSGAADFEENVESWEVESGAVGAGDAVADVVSEGCDDSS